jgi:hypothetical protein
MRNEFFDGKKIMGFENNIIYDVVINGYMYIKSGKNYFYNNKNLL